MSSNDSQSEGRSTKISKKGFVELFDFEENERDNNQIKKDYKKIEKKQKGGAVKFKHLIDFYLTSSESFGEQMKEIDARKILEPLDSENDSGFNERLLRLICVNQAIMKMQKELGTLQYIKEDLLASFEEQEPSDKLQEFITTLKVKQPNFQSNQDQPVIDKNIQQIDLKLQNMMQFMNDFAVNFQQNPVSASNQFYRPSSSSYSIRPSSSGYRAGLLTTHVWPKSRMLFAIVSKMSKEGFLNEQQRGILKDLILDYDSRLQTSLQDYEISGDRDKLYYNLINVANSSIGQNQ
eukprot:403338163